MLEMDLDNLVTSCDFVENILKFGNEAEMMSVKRIMLNRLQKLYENRVQSEPEENAVLTFEPVDDELKVRKFANTLSMPNIFRRKPKSAVFSYQYLPIIASFIPLRCNIGTDYYICHYKPLIFYFVWQDSIMKLGRLGTSLAFPPMSVAEGAGLKIVKVGHLAAFKVFAKDRFGEDVTNGK